MRCPYCDMRLGDGMLPSRCPNCGKSLHRARREHSRRHFADAAAKRAKSVRGLVDVADKREIMSRNKRLAFAFVFVVLTAAAFVYLTYVIQLWGGRTVPDVVGWRQESAVDAIRRAGFPSSVEYQKSDGEPGFVLSMSPNPGGRADTATTITVYVSDACMMPAVVGTQRADAEAAVAAEGLKAVIDEYPSDEEPGMVIAASVEAGTVMSEGVEVRLGVARARVVPQVMGKQEADARSAIEGEGGVVTVAYVAPQAGQADGSVVACDPPCGEGIENGQDVTISVARALTTAMDQSARAAVNAIYGCGDPAAAGTGVGAALRGCLSSEAKAGDQNALSASDHDLWYGFVKHNRKLPDNVNAEIDELVRHLESVDSVEVDEGAHTVRATFRVTWDWGKMGSSYRGMTNADTRTVTFVTDGEGKLVSMDDPQTDIPFYDVV